MTTLILRFPAGRYRNNPWSVDADTPPSPWRLLRTLHATWRTRVPDLDTTTVHSLLTALAVPPTWHVPATRQEGGMTVLDEDADLAAIWLGQLSEEQHKALRRLADAIPYLGRADNHCTARVDDRWTADRHHRWEALDVADSVGDEPVATVLAPEIPFDVAALLARSPHDAPVGVRLLAYQRYDGLTAPATMIRLDIIGQRPPATETVAVTDRLRRAALARLGALRGSQARTQLGGREADSSVLRDQHAHTTYLPILDRDQLTAVVAWTPVGLAADEVTALQGLTRLSSNHHRIRLRLAPTTPAAISVHAPALVGPARTWTSRTPYVLTRYPKKRDLAAFFAADVTRELRHRELPEPTSVEIIAGSWWGWRRHRPSVAATSAQGRADREGAFLRLTFSDPISGPLSLGHLSHFGLGLFTPGR